MMPPAKSSKPQAKSAKSEPGPWDWACKTAIDDIGLNELKKAYRITGFTACKTQCRRNCKKNPKCLWGLGERKWLQVGEEPADDPEETNDVVRNEGQIVGIQNLGATCYVNSLLQLWFHNPILRRAILEWTPPTTEIIDPENYVPTCPIGHLQAMFARLKLSKQSSIDPSPFVMALELNAGEQQDAQEFAKLLLTLIDELLAKYQHQSVRTVIKDAFTGDCQYETECSVCKTKTIQQSVFNELELTVHKHLRDSIDQYLKEEILEGSNKYRCRTCRLEQVAQRSIKLKKLPPVLNLQLMRFVYDIETHRKKKVTTTIRFPEDLDMTEYILPEFRDGQKLVYKLTAVLIHDGKSASSGHYVAHIKDISSGAWYNCNDENVEKKTQSLKKSTALVLNEATDSSEVTNGNGTSCAPKVVAPVPQKVKSHSSAGAYMLVYTRLDLHDNPPSDPEVHDYLLHLVGREDAVFEADLAKTKAEKESEERKREDKQKEIDKLYEWYKIQAAQMSRRSGKQSLNREDSQSQLNGGPKVGDDQDDLEFFPASWLANWVGEKQPDDEEIQTASLLCKHGNLTPPLPNDTVVPYRLLPVWFVDSMYAKYGGQGRLQGEQVLCLRCVKEQCTLIKNLATLEEDYKLCVEIIKQIDKDVTNSNQTEDFLSDKVWASKDALRCWKRYAKDEIQMSNVERSSNEESFVFNDDIICDHGNMDPSENSRKLINVTVWSIIAKYFPEAKSFKGDETPCSQCNEIINSTSVSASKNRAIAQKQKAALSDLFHNKNRPHPENDIGGFYLVPTTFVDMWRKFVKNPASITPNEIEIWNSDLLCGHNKFKYALGLIKEVQQAQGCSDSIVTLLKPEEWEYIKEEFGPDREVRMMRGPNELKYYPELCEDCSTIWYSSAMQKSLSYSLGDIYVEKLDLSEKDPGSPDQTSDTSSDQSNYSVPLKKERREQLPISNGIRRSTRTRHTPNQKRYQVSSTMTLKEFQLKLMLDYQALLSDQHIMFEGKELTAADRGLTLGQLRIKPGSVLKLKVDEHRTDDSIEESPVQERGFSGTILQGHSRQVAMEH